MFLGRELGARSEDTSCYVDGRVQYARLARTDLFQNGLQRVRDESKDHRLALMCAEKDPLECHRSILVARQLNTLGILVNHILENGEVESQDAILEKLLHRFYKKGDNETDMFRSRAEMIEDACAIQAKRIAYEENKAIKELETAGGYVG